MTDKPIVLTDNAKLTFEMIEFYERIKKPTRIGKNMVYLFILGVKQMNSEDFAGIGKSIAIESGLASSSDTYESLEKLGRDWVLKKCESFLVALKVNISVRDIH